MPLTPLHAPTGAAQDVRARETAHATEPLDALPRMSHRARMRTIPETQPGPGRYLVVEDGDEHRLLRLTPGATHIGRAWAADLRLDDHAVSRRHAIVYATADSVRILDDRSANGTRVNGRCVTGAQLADGDVILVGRVVLTYREFG